MIISSNQSSNSAELLIINKDAFAELVNIDKQNNLMTFRLRWRVSLRTTEDVRNYEKIVIKARVINSTNNILEQINGNSKETPQKVNQQGDASKKPQGIYSENESIASQTQSKLISGLKQLELLKGTQVDGTIVTEKDVLIVPFGLPKIPADVSEYNYTFVETFVPAIRPQRNELIRSDSSLFNPHNAIETINRHGLMPGSVFSESIDSSIDIFDPNFITGYLSNKKEVSLDYLRYFLSEVPSSNFENKSIFYETRETTANLDFFEMISSIDIPLSLKTSTLKITFEVQKELNEIVETRTLDLNCLSHYQAYRATIYPPELVVTGNKVDNVCYLSIKDNLNDSEIVSYNVYLTTFDSYNAIVKSNTFIASVLRSNIKDYLTVVPSQPLNVFKVVPVNIDGVESHVFEQIVWGQNKILNSIIIDAYKIPNNQESIYVKIYNIPSDCKSINLYKRKLGNGFTRETSSFRLASTISSTFGTTETVVLDLYEPGEIYEYFAEVDNGSIIKNISKFIIYKHPLLAYFEDPIDVRIIPFESANPDIPSFSIRTTMSEKEDDKVTKVLKELSTELYDYFVNSANISASAIPRKDYTGIIVHEIVRINLTTSERESFPLMGDGEFSDTFEFASKNAIKPFNPLNKYVYKILTYRRNPLTLFKDYVESGNVQGKQWFYSPYKWENPVTKLTGILYPENNGTPVIDTYETMTTEQYGLVHEIKSNNYIDSISIRDISAIRLDINTVKIYWSVYMDPRIPTGINYDSYCVMKVVNGIRKFLGKTNKTYIYHELTPHDVGSVYYIVVPIMSEYEPDDPGYSNEIFVDSEFITPILYKNNRNLQ